MRHLTWETGENVIEGHLRQATEDEIPDPPAKVTVPDVDELERGDQYNGPRKGYQFSVNADGRPFEQTSDGRRYIDTEEYHDIAAYVHREKGGTVTVNDENHALTYLGDELVFIDVVTDPDEITYSEDGSGSLTDPSGIGLDDF